MQHYETKGTVKNLFISFLTDRQQFVYSINNSQFSKKLINYVVPQGFVLGLLLYT